jgi:hypothetical protein
VPPDAWVDAFPPEIVGRRHKRRLAASGDAPLFQRQEEGELTMNRTPFVIFRYAVARAATLMATAAATMTTTRTATR